MPFTHTCRDHPDWTADVLDGVLLHVGAQHPGMSSARALADDGPISVRFMSQTEAQGHTRLRIFKCVCGRRVETREVGVDTCPDCAPA